MRGKEGKTEIEGGRGRKKEEKEGERERERGKEMEGREGKRKKERGRGRERHAKPSWHTGVDNEKFPRVRQGQMSSQETPCPT